MRTALALVVVAGLASAGQAQESPRAVIERAITAHGGYEKLARVRADRVRFRGVLHVAGSSVPFTDEVTMRLPGYYRSIVVMTEKGRSRTIVHTLEGDQASITLDGQPQQVSGVHLAQLRQTLDLRSAILLVPLLNDPACKLSFLGAFGLQGKEVLGISVQGKGQRDLKMYFDRQTGLLVKGEYQLDNPIGKEVRQEVFYSDYREVGGYLRPCRLAAYRDGKKVMEGELLEAVPLDSVPLPTTQQH